MKEPDAKATFRTVTTYGIAVLVLLEAGLAAVSLDAVRMLGKPEFEGPPPSSPGLASASSSTASIC